MIKRIVQKIKSILGILEFRKEDRESEGQSTIRRTSGFENLSTALISDSIFEALHF